MGSFRQHFGCESGETTYRWQYYTHCLCRREMKAGRVIGGSIMWSPGSCSVSTFGEDSGVSSAVCPTPILGIYSFHRHKKFSMPYRQLLEIDKIRQTKISCMKRGESVSGDQTCPDMQRTDRQPEIFSYAEARMVTIMLNIILCHQSGKTGTKVLAPFSVYKDHKHAFFPMISKAAMVMSAAPGWAPRSGCWERSCLRTS